MDKSLHSNISSSGSRKGKTPAVHLLRGLISGAVFFTLSLLIFSFVLSKTASPENYVTAAAAATISLTALAASFAANFGREKGFIQTGSICALFIILLLVILSLIFGKSEAEKNYLFPAVIYVAVFVFSLLGARLSMSKKKRRKRTR